MHHIDPKIRKRLRQSGIISMLLWGFGVALTFLRAPFWLLLLLGIVGGYFALRDWETVRSLALKAVSPGHPDPDVQALIDGKIDISEYRQRKEKNEAV